MGVEGSYYAKYIDKLKLNDQIGFVPWETSFKVHTAWDIGYAILAVLSSFRLWGRP